MNDNFILIDTQVIIAGATSTTASGPIPAVTEATATEIQSMRPEFNLSGFVKLKSPTFKDFVEQQNGYYIWTRGDNVGHRGTGDKCLQSIIQCIESKKLT